MKLFLTTCVLLGLAAALNRSASAELQIGDEAPDFTLTGSDGKTYRLADFRGKQAVVVAWYPRAFTGGCTAECKSLRDHSKELKKFEAAYFTASCDTVELNTKFAKELELDYPILSDPDTKVAEAYGLLAPGKKTATRWTFYIGKDGKIAHIEKSVKTATHGADVAAKLRELGVPEKK